MFTPALIWNGFVEYQNWKNLLSLLATEHANLGLVKNCLNSIKRWVANVTILLFTRTFETWDFRFFRNAKGMQYDPLVFWKLKGDVLFLHYWKYMVLNIWGIMEEEQLFLNANYYFTDKQKLI